MTAAPSIGEPDAPLAGRSALIVEDEMIIAELLMGLLTELGCIEVRHAGRLGEALALIEAQLPDVALLDLNLAGELGYPVADRLVAAGVPFIFATGISRGAMPARWQHQPGVQKPFRREALANALAAAFAAQARPEPS